jgi:hypothetical protein
VGLGRQDDQAGANIGALGLDEEALAAAEAGEEAAVIGAGGNRCPWMQTQALIKIESVRHACMPSGISFPVNDSH